jgi:hypothetical protein
MMAAHVISQLNEQLKKAQEKIYQGSMQTQGGVSEIQFEKILRTTYPLDDIQVVAKDAKEQI